MYSSLTAVHWFNNGYVGKQPEAWKEYCVEYCLKELQKNMNRCTDRRDITEILLKTALNIIQSINNLTPNLLADERSRSLSIGNRLISWLIDWRFRPLSTVFQSYHGDSSHFSYLSWVSPVLGWDSEVPCLRTLPWKNPEDPVWLELRTPEYESNTLPLSHAGPISGIKLWTL